MPGAGAIKSLEAQLDGEADVTWISATDYHLVLHESHRCIRDPSVEEHVTVPVEAIKSPERRSGRGAKSSTSTPTSAWSNWPTTPPSSSTTSSSPSAPRTAFFGIEGLREYAHTLKSLDDAFGIHDAVADAARDATQSDPAQVVVGGAGLSGIQTAGEIAKYRDEHRAPIEIHLVEGLDEVMPNGDPELQGAIRKRLLDRDINIMCGEFIGEVDEDIVYIGDDDELGYDELIWTGGITGREAVHDVDVDKDERSHRINAEQDFQTTNRRIFAIGDCALVDQPGDDPAPPTAQAAWQAAEVAGENLARAIRGRPLPDVDPRRHGDGRLYRRHCRRSRRLLHGRRRPHRHLRRLRGRIAEEGHRCQSGSTPSPARAAP